MIRKHNARKSSKKGMSFLQLVESFSQKPDSTEGLDEFEDYDGDVEDDEIDDSDIDIEADGDGDTVNLTIDRDDAEKLLSILQTAVDGGTIESDDDEIDDDLEIEEDSDDVDLESDEDSDLDADDFEDEDEEDDDEYVDEDEEVVITDGGPSMKTGTPGYKRSGTVDNTILKPSSSGKANACDFSDGAPTMKTGTPGFRRSGTVDKTRIAPNKHIFEI